MRAVWAAGTAISYLPYQFCAVLQSAPDHPSGSLMILKCKEQERVRPSSGNLAWEEVTEWKRAFVALADAVRSARDSCNR